MKSNLLRGYELLGGFDLVSFFSSIDETYLLELSQLETNFQAELFRRLSFWGAVKPWHEFN